MYAPYNYFRDVDKFDRIFQLHAILSSRRTPIPLEELMARLECSKSTLHRAINALKNHLNAPVVFDAEADGNKCGGLLEQDGGAPRRLTELTKDRPIATLVSGRSLSWCSSNWPHSRPAKGQPTL